MTTRTARGFTLLELLVAISIFAVLSTLSYGSVRHLLSFNDGLEHATRRYEALRFAIAIMEQDFAALAPRSVRDALGAPEPALRAGLKGELLTFTRRMPDLGPFDVGPALRRVRYRVQDGDLYRDVWDVLDRTPDSGFHSQRLLRDVKSLKLRFFESGAWVEFWPRDDNAVSQAELPHGVEFTLEMRDARRLRRVLARPG
ncbi:MAG: type II secretion system minor pseudopilin GspJ [Proteobacteria bacterium]|nr:type II secretion system minor pseudopilin GspJ [Pseudomonadota bacterium]